ncbi:MAG: hypothetical protein ABI467_26220 [Kofleriaceae bacterium]
MTKFERRGNAPACSGCLDVEEDVTIVAEVRRISLRRLLSRLTVLVLSGTPVAYAATAPNAPRLRGDDLDDQDLDETPIDREEVGRNEAAALLGRNMAMALSQLPALDAIHLATSWAISEDPIRRAAIARSLEWTFPLLADSVIIEHLSHDPDPATRAAAARAAWVRRASGGDEGVLDRLAHDPDLEVRSVALRARRG